MPLRHGKVISAYDSVLTQWHKLTKVSTAARQRDRRYSNRSWIEYKRLVDNRDQWKLTAMRIEPGQVRWTDNIHLKRCAGSLTPEKVLGHWSQT